MSDRRQQRKKRSVSTLSECGEHTLFAGPLFGPPVGIAAALANSSAVALDTLSTSLSRTRMLWPVATDSATLPVSAALSLRKISCQCGEHTLFACTV